MTETKSVLSSINQLLVDTFNVKEWSHTQIEVYRLIQQFTQSFKEDYRRYDLRSDKCAIRDNFKDQTWFACSRCKPIISQWIDRMKLVHYGYDQTSTCLHFNLTMSFDQFILVGGLYKNEAIGCLNFYIYVESTNHCRAYLTLYNQWPKVKRPVRGAVMELEEPNAHKIPEFDQIYQIIGLSSSMVTQSDLLCFFSEIIMYYDVSGSVGQIPINNTVPYTIDQLSHRLNAYLTQKKSSTDYTIIGSN